MDSEVARTKPIHAESVISTDRFGVGLVGHRLRMKLRRADPIQSLSSNEIIGRAVVTWVRGVPRSTARGWLTDSDDSVVTAEDRNLDGTQLQREGLQLRRRIQKLISLLPVSLVVL